MLTIPTSSHILTNRLRRSFRAAPTSTGIRLRRVESSRLFAERLNLLVRQRRREWIAERWSFHSRSVVRIAQQSRT
jgi:hypothetical protein